MDRRKFLGSMVGGVAVAAAARTWPFRVYSFPTEIERPRMVTITHNYYDGGRLVRRDVYQYPLSDFELVLAT